MAGMVNPSETYTAWSIGEGAHEVTGLKPMLNPEEQVALLKAKGVSFERCGEEQAADALARRGTFVHLAFMPQACSRSTRPATTPGEVREA